MLGRLSDSSGCPTLTQHTHAHTHTNARTHTRTHTHTHTHAHTHTQVPCFIYNYTKGNEQVGRENDDALPDKNYITTNKYE